MEDAFRQRLSEGKYQDGKQHRRRYHAGMFRGLRILSGKIGNDQPQKGKGTDQRRRTGDIERYGNQESAYAAVIIDAEADGLAFAKGDDIEQFQIATNSEGRNRKDDGIDGNDLRMHVVEGSHQCRQQCVVFIGIHETNHHGLQGAEERCENRSDQKDTEDPVPCLLKQAAGDDDGHEAHHGNVEQKRARIAQNDRGSGTEEEVENRMKQGIERIHTKQAGGARSGYE